MSHAAGEVGFAAGDDEVIARLDDAGRKHDVVEVHLVLERLGQLGTGFEERLVLGRQDLPRLVRVEPHQIVGKYRTYWSLLDPDQPWKVLATQHEPLLEANPDLTEPIKEQMYLDNVVFSTGIVEADDHFIVASGEADLACRITHIPKDAFVPA